MKSEETENMAIEGEKKMKCENQGRQWLIASTYKWAEEKAQASTEALCHRWLDGILLCSLSDSFCNMVMTCASLNIYVSSNLWFGSGSGSVWDETLPAVEKEKCELSISNMLEWWAGGPFPFDLTA